MKFARVSVPAMDEFCEMSPGLGVLAGALSSACDSAIWQQVDHFFSRDLLSRSSSYFSKAEAVGNRVGSNRSMTHAFNPDECKDLLARYQSKLIKTQVENEQALAATCFMLLHSDLLLARRCGFGMSGAIASFRKLQRQM